MKPSITRKELYPYYLFLLASVIYVYYFQHAVGFLIINEMHNPLLDRIMPFFTLLGDGVTAVIVALLMALLSIRTSIFLLVSFALSGVAVQLLKRLVFSESPRPLAYFRDLGIEIYTLPGLDIPLRHSFPSGHTATAFALFIGISFLVKRWYYKAFFLLLAIIVGYSRVYLAMHFPVDVIAGSLLGVLTAYLCFIWISGWKKSWLDVSLGLLIKNALKK